MIELLKLKYFYIILLSFISLVVVTSNKISADQKINIIADEIIVEQSEKKVKATGNAVAKDEKRYKN